MIAIPPDITLQIAVNNEKIVIEITTKNNNSIGFRVDKNLIGVSTGKYISYLSIKHTNNEGGEILNEYGRADISKKILTGYRGPYSENDILEIPPNGTVKALFDISKYFAFLPGCNHYSISYAGVFDFPLKPVSSENEDAQENIKMLISETKPMFFEYCKNE